MPVILFWFVVNTQFSPFYDSQAISKQKFTNLHIFSVFVFAFIPLINSIVTCFDNDACRFNCESIYLGISYSSARKIENNSVNNKKWFIFVLFGNFFLYLVISNYNSSSANDTYCYHISIHAYKLNASIWYNTAKLMEKKSCLINFNNKKNFYTKISFSINFKTSS